MSLTISYKGVDIVDETADCTKTLKTAGEYCEADIEVDYTSEAPTLISKSITANGEYSASADGADGYSSVSVDVPSDPYEFWNDVANQRLSGDVVAPTADAIEMGMFDGRSGITGITFPTATLCGFSFFRNKRAPDTNYFAYTCVDLKKLVLPKLSQGYISSYFASYCPLLALVVTNFPRDASPQGSSFNNNPALKSFVLLCSNGIAPPLGNTNIFANSGAAPSVDNGYIYVPDALVSTIKGMSNWSYYADNIKGFSDADAYSSSKQYTVGDVCLHGGKFYAWINLTDGNTEPTGAVDSYTDWYCCAEVS